MNQLKRKSNPFINFLRRPIRETCQKGLSVLFRKCRTLLLIVLAIPVVVLVRALQPLVLIRFGRLESRRIGHFIENTEIYLSERDGGMHDHRTFDIFYHYLPISNYQVKKMWERTGRLCISPFTAFTQAIDRFNRLLPGGQRHTISPSARDVYGLRAHTKPYLSFTPEEERLGRRELQKLGIFDGAPFVCFHARDSAYLDTTYLNYRWRYQDFRDSSIHNYISAAEELAHRGYFMFRMGTVVKKALHSNNPRIIDYATNARTDFLDIYLSAKCRFFICDTAGISSAPTAFKRPIAWVNYIRLGYIPSGVVKNLLIPKKLWLCKEHRFLTFREILDSDIGRFNKAEEYEQVGIEPVENTPEEIVALAVEMDERLKGKWQTTEEDEELQRRFYALLNPCNLNLKQIVIPRIGAEFLRQNPGFLE
ncbi:MAG: TIGR04372 family glycosyltransferase [Candidatus Omnitrophota bacterium]|nr:MAG: TIGR04372 family glycosyltransferase [Candidatus Omnitrophota bacterium]